MRIKIRHETTYVYGEPARGAVQLLRLTPRSSAAQFVRSWRVTIDADARLDRGEDAYGNITHLAFVEGPLSALKILAEGEVDTSDDGGVVARSAERLPERLFLRETALTLPTPAIRALARDAVASEGGDRVAGLHRLNASLHAAMTFKIGATTAATTAGEAFTAQTGVNRDFAHIFIAAARAVGVPSRYVSGYHLRADGVTQEAGHAWAEAHVPGIGWIAFDPANGQCAAEHHVRIAIGCDGNDAAPLRGARSGGASEKLEVAIAVSQGRVILGDSGGPAQTTQSQGQQ